MLLITMADDPDNIYFKKLVDLVPPQFYFTPEEKDLIRNTDGDHSQTEDIKTSKKRKKKSHHDPLNAQSVSSLQAALSAREEKIKGKKESKQKKKKKEKEKNGINIQEAQAKLRARIAELQAKRTLGLSSLELQEQKRLARKQRRMNARSQKNKKNKKDGAGQDDGVPVGSTLIKPPPKPIVTKDGKLVFSKFDFTQSGDKEKTTGLAGKDYKRILERLEQRDEKVAKIKESDAVAATKLEQKHVWQDVLAKAKGEKVKDDVGKLKKAIKRKEKMKEQRVKKWDQRQQTVESQQAKKQEKREQNLQKRRDDKKAKHRKKLIKKGRILPGF